MSNVPKPGASELSSSLISPVTGEIDDEAARQLNEMINFPSAQRDKTINIEQVVTKAKADFEKAKAEVEARAQYKIEVHFDRHRSASSLALNAGCLLIWESGKFFHGGGDEKMYWCGYKDCGKPLSSSNFAYMHAVCPMCKREMFLDPNARQMHIDHLQQLNQPLNDIDQLPMVVGERLFRLSNDHLADLLVKTFRELDSNADIYLKFHPLDIRYDTNVPVLSSKIEDGLNSARLRRQPLIYPLKNILKDTLAGADLKTRFKAMLLA